MSRVSSRRVKMTFYDLEHSVHEDIIAMTNDPAVISTKVTALLNGLHPEDNFVVCRVAKEISEAIAIELAFKDGDMVTVIRTLGAVLNSSNRNRSSLLSDHLRRPMSTA
jgi:hypothetical protein